MFTGLVETTGELMVRDRRGPGFRIGVKTGLGPLELGDSISVSGACLTVVAATSRGFEADVSLETAEKTTLGRLPLGGAVNLERALAAGDRLGGHLVSGHVDGIARVLERQSVGDTWKVVLSAPSALMRYVAPKGSVALDGVSLTVNGVARDRFDIVLIPHTRAVTNMQDLEPGTELNLEVDLIARYVVRFLESAADTAGARDAGLAELLARAGMSGTGESRG